MTTTAYNTLAPPSPAMLEQFWKDMAAITEHPLLGLLRGLGGDPARQTLVISRSLVEQLASEAGYRVEELTREHESIIVSAYVPETGVYLVDKSMFSAPSPFIMP